MRDQIFSAIADPHRRRILELLRAGERSAGEIASQFDVSWPAVSRHLRVLRDAGLVAERREGRSRRYRLEARPLYDAVGGWVADFDAMWERNLAALKRHVETRTSSRRPKP